MQCDQVYQTTVAMWVLKEEDVVRRFGAGDVGTEDCGGRWCWRGGNEWWICNVMVL